MSKPDGKEFENYLPEDPDWSQQEEALKELWNEVQFKKILDRRKFEGDVWN